MNSQTRTGRASFLQVVRQNIGMLARLQSAPARLVIIGNFNAGKSTLLNALVGSRLLPSGLKPTTGTVIRIVRGAQEQTTVRFLDGRMQTQPGTSLLTEYAVIGAPGNSELLEDIQVETPTAFFANGCTVVDVPGMEDDPARYEAIFREILFADLALSVHDIEQQMPLSEIELLRDEVIAAGCDSLTVIFNKCNLLPEEGVAEALEGAVDRLHTLGLTPPPPLRPWYRIDAQPELRRLLAGERISAGFQTFLEDLHQALPQEAASLQESRSRKLAALQAALYTGGGGLPDLANLAPPTSFRKGTDVKTFAQARQETLQLCQESITQAQKSADLKQRLTSTREDLAQGKLTVVVAGEFKRGKSMLLDAFLNVPELLPTDYDIATSVVSNVLYGEKERVRVVLGESGQEKIEDISRSQIRDYVTERGNPRNQRRVRLLLIELPKPELKDGLTFVDTPGIGGVFAEHTAVTYAYLPNADVVLFVTDALKPLTTDDLDFLRDRILPHTRHIVFVLTKIDKVDDYQPIVDSNRAKLAALMEQAPETIQIVPVSSLLKLRHGQATYPDPADLEDSNFTVLKETIWRLLRERRGQILLQRTLVEVARGLTQLRAPLQAEWDTIQQRSKEDQEAQERKYQEAQQTLRGLTDHSAAWHNTLRDGLADIRSRLQGEFQNGFVRIRRQMNSYLGSSRLLEEPETIASYIEADIDGMMAELGHSLNAEANALHGRLEAETGLDINPFEGASVAWEPPTFNPDGRTAPRRTVYEQAMTVGRGAVYSASAGATAGAIIGGAVGGTIGFVLGGPLGALAGAKIGAALGGSGGAIAGKVSGVKQTLREVRQPDRAFYLPLLREFIEDSERSCHSAFEQSIREAERAMRDELQGQLVRSRQAAEAALVAVQAARKRSAEETQARIVPLQKELQAVVRLQERAAELSRIATSFAPEPASEAARPASAQAPSADMGDWAND